MTEQNEISQKPSQELIVPGKKDTAQKNALAQRGYVVETRGSTKRIISRSTGQSSSRFHEIDVEIGQGGNVRALIGKLGSKKRAIAFKEDPETHQELIVESEPFHRLKYDPGSGLLLVSVGAMEQIMDPKTGEIISDSFHKIKRKGSLLIGIKGSFQYIIDPETGKKASDGYHSIEEKDGKVIGRIGTKEEVID